MIIPDLNLLVYAYDTASPFHARAAAWWSACLSADETVGLPLPVLFGYLRIVTMARLFERPLSVSEAAENVRSWLARPVTQVLEPPPAHVDDVLTALEGLGTAGNLVTDAQLAALAISYGAVLHTADTDFLRFAGLRCHNPLTS